MAKPIKQLRSGNISAAIWENERKVNGDVMAFKTVSLRRSWKDKEKDIWRDETINFRRQDVPKIMAIMAKLQEELYLTAEEN
ncbi:MAG: hypothetical protein ABIB71_07295 [Candidatus Woesearchaeota archaeon]